MIGEEIQHLGGMAVLPNSINTGEIDYFEDVDEGEWLVLFFYPADFTWVCPTELQEIRDRYAEFVALNANVWAISTDGIEVHQKWVKEAFGSLPYPLVSDRNWELSAEFGSLNASQGVSYRCTVMIDRSGIIRHYSVNDNNVGRNIGEILRLIAAFQQSDSSDGQVAQCGWNPGMDLLTPGE
jgi:alkyl hydroperoxide reductase subunit AhpC